MPVSTDWQERFANNKNHSVWPWSDLVSAVMRSRPKQSAFRVLEFGCGVGANVPLFLSLGAAYHAIEGSPTACAVVIERYPELDGNVIVGDFSEPVACAQPFDLIVDRAAVTHNDTVAICAALANAHRMLAQGGVYIGVDWISSKHGDYRHGRIDGDAFTRSGFTDGPFAGLGRVHFSDEAHMRSLFAEFEIESLEEKCVDRVHPLPARRHAAWNIIARKSERIRPAPPLNGDIDAHAGIFVRG